MGPLEAMVFLDASSYFWTPRGISARVHNERAAGRAGGRGKDGKTISGHIFGRADKLPKLFLHTSSAKLFLGTSPGGRAGGQAAKLFLDASCYFWTRRGISARVHNEPAAGRAGGRGKDGKTISGHVFGRAGGRTGCQSYFWTRLQQNYFWARLRAGGRADRLAKLFLDASCYFWTRRGISARVLLFLDASWYFCTRS